MIIDGQPVLVQAGAQMVAVGIRNVRIQSHLALHREPAVQVVLVVQTTLTGAQRRISAVLVAVAVVPAPVPHLVQVVAVVIPVVVSVLIVVARKAGEGEAILLRQSCRLRSHRPRTVEYKLR